MKLLLQHLTRPVEVIERDGLEEMAELAAQGPFELILLDLKLRGVMALDQLSLIQQQFPNTAVVVLSALESESAIQEARAKGARGYLLKSETADGILSALSDILSGLTRFPFDVPQPATDITFTPRQMDVLRLVCAGRVNKDIAQQLGMSANTVRTHMMYLFRLLGVRTRTEAALVARQLGIL
jgi:DNA-binding NarL/FixJ family response regulator